MLHQYDKELLLLGLTLHSGVRSYAPFAIMCATGCCYWSRGQQPEIVSGLKVQGASFRLCSKLHWDYKRSVVLI